MRNIQPRGSTGVLQHPAASGNEGVTATLVASFVAETGERRDVGPRRRGTNLTHCPVEWALIRVARAGTGNPEGGPG